MIGKQGVVSDLKCRKLHICRYTVNNRFMLGEYMSLLMLSGILLVLVGIGFMGLSARYFYLGVNELYGETKFKKSIFKKC